VAGEGLLVVDKPAGWTSHDVVAVARGLTGTRRVGHAGTLDPMATGVLLLGVGRATRLLTFLVGCDKSYTATIRLGQSTLTDDADGELTSAADVSALTPGQVDDAVTALTGVIEQVPSAVSAVKVGGRRAYARVRAGEDVHLAPRRVTVSRFEVLARRSVHATGPDPTGPDAAGASPTATSGYLDLDVVVDVGSGTYVRALARDLGAALGVGGHLTALRRTRVGHFGLDRATAWDRLREPGAGLPLLSIDEAARATFAVRELSPEEASAVAHGQRIPSRRGPAASAGTSAAAAPDVVAAFGPNGRLVALLDESAQLARSRVVFASS